MDLSLPGMQTLVVASSRRYYISSTILSNIQDAIEDEFYFTIQGIIERWNM
jgi:hypothetical protein